MINDPFYCYLKSSSKISYDLNNNQTATVIFEASVAFKNDILLAIIVPNSFQYVYKFIVYCGEFLIKN